MKRSRAMVDRNEKPNGSEEETAKGNEWKCPCGTGEAMMSCCGPEMTENMKNMKKMPCRTVFRRHRFAIFTMLTMGFLAVMVSQIGGVLGIIAFFRTL
jgi:hypothetical protein